MKNFIVFLFTLLLFSTVFSNTARSAFATARSAAGTAERGEDEKEKAGKLTSSTFSGLKFRSLGPALRSGRIGDFAVNPGNTAEYYVAVASGGVWKTVNDGITYESVFDGQKSYSIGCVELDPNNPHVVWVGTGENNSQRSVSYGDGIYRSSDGGKNWKNMGLGRSEHIGKIVIDPNNSSVVYVAAQGPLWGPGGDRGLYKTTDAGKSWNAVLTISENTGVTDVVMDPRDSDVLYAASYQRRRHVWTLINGGPESRLYKTTDGGASWDTLTTGLPGGDVGRIGLAIAPADPDVLYAIVEAAENKGGIFRSTDRGASWAKRCDLVSASAQYYQELVCDPNDVNTVYSLDTYTRVSTDGFKTHSRLGNNRRHVDDHALWIDPSNTRHLLIGGDGGVYDTYDRGKTWRYKENLPVTQFYRVSVDNSEPFYYIYGGTQDNNSIGGPSRTIKSAGIMNEDWIITIGGDGYETQVDPDNPDIVYSQYQYGGLYRYDKRSGERLGLKPQSSPGEPPLRWNWDSPLLISPHASKRLYFAANKLFRSDDRGSSWKVISPDLTRRIDRNTLPVMDKIWPPEAVAKNASTSLYGNIVSLSESPLVEGLIYIGTDDGLLQVTEDGGENWRKIESFSGVPEMTYVSCVLASRHDANVVYAAFDNHKMDDFKPYVLRSDDRGRSWTAVTEGLAENGPVYSLAEDAAKSTLIFAGTEFGVFFSPSAGERWIQLKGDLPPIAVRDIALQNRETDLVLGTFGRGFYVLDDYSSLREVDDEMMKEKAHLFAGRDALMYIPSRSRPVNNLGSAFYTSPNPPFGATFTYYLKEAPESLKQKRKKEAKAVRKAGGTPPYPDFSELRKEDLEKKSYLLFTINDEQGNIVRRLRAPATAGVNRITWNLRHADLRSVGKNTDISKSSGIPAMPGRYSISMSIFDNGIETPLAGPVGFETRVLGHTTLPAEDREALVDFQSKIVDLSRTTLATLRFANSLDEKLVLIGKALELTPGTSTEMRDRYWKAGSEMAEVQRLLRGDASISSRNANQSPSISDRMQNIIYQMWNSTSSPRIDHAKEYEHVRGELAPVLERLRTLHDGDLRLLEQELDRTGAPWTPGRIPVLR